MAPQSITTTSEPEMSRHEDRRENLGEEIDPAAIGGTLADMAKGYYLTPSFLATFIATCMGVSCFKLGYVLPINTLAIINADIGSGSQPSREAKTHFR